MDKVSKHYCNVCAREFQDDYALQGHLTGKKHKMAMKCQMKDGFVVISPLPEFITQRKLIEFLFHKYGSIKAHKFGPNYLMIEFANRNVTEQLLNKPVLIGDVKLNISKRLTKPKANKSNKSNNPIEDKGVISYANIKYIFEDETVTFDEQLMHFLNIIRLTDEEMEMRYGPVCSHLDKIFRTKYPKCKTYLFGSIVTELAFKQCDLDMYMYIGEPINDSKVQGNGNITISKVLNEVKKMMYRMRNVFSDIVSLPKARIPIIKFCYVPTNVLCDLSFKNSLGIYKSYLIRYLISLDNRLKPLMMLIKYWARHFKLASGSSKMSNHGLILLIIFYLQQPHVSIIPPLYIIQHTCEPLIINGWQVNFNSEVTLPPITNTSTIPELLHGFFSFYAKFWFKSRVICPIDGKIYKDWTFTGANVDCLPDFMDRYKACVREDSNSRLPTNTPMCVQDPIELNHNAVAITSQTTLTLFKKYCEIGAEICAMTASNNYKDLLKTLFTMICKEGKVKEAKFDVIVTRSGINKNEEQKSENNSTEKTNIPDGWFQMIVNMVKEIFEKVFLLQIDIIPDNTVNGEASAMREAIFLCTGSHCVWRCRKTNTATDPSFTCMQKEALISTETAKNNIKSRLQFACTLERQDPAKILITVTNWLGPEQAFQEFATFAKPMLIKLIQEAIKSIVTQESGECADFPYTISVH